jgi:hypothetical protein
MDIPSILLAVSRDCLRGRPVPKSLAKLWELELADDSFAGADLELLESLSILDLGYGEEDATLPGDVGANVKAHRKMFEALGFFAADADGGFLAIHLELGDPDEPPVVHLDSEGQYRWLGASLGEALVALAEESEDDEAAQAWLSQHGISTDPPLGVSVAALPDLGGQHRKFFDAFRGKAAVVPVPKAAPKASAKSFESEKPLTWIGAPATKVQAVLKELVPAKEKSKLGNWLAADERGKVKTVWLSRTPKTENFEVKSARFGMTRAHVLETLGRPTREGAQWVRYDAPTPSLHLEFKDGAVVRMTLMASAP